jgi:hypothetical protein
VTVDVVTTVAQSVFHDGQVPVRYLIRSDKGFRKEADFLLLGPYSEDGEEKHDERHEQKGGKH